MIALIVPVNQTKVRKRKPFNSMVGETFEMVTNDMKFVAEQIAHLPTPVAAFHLEGEGYTMQGYGKVKPPVFSWGGGKGTLEIEQCGVYDLYFKNFDELISI
jgi:hypothetical protein